MWHCGEVANDIPEQFSTFGEISRDWMKWDIYLAFVPGEQDTVALTWFLFSGYDSFQQNKLIREIKKFVYLLNSDYASLYKGQ